jgi:hypothetical protein
VGTHKYPLEVRRIANFQLVPLRMTSLNIPVEWEALVLREITGSKLGPVADYSDRFIRDISEKCSVTYRPTARQRRDKLNSQERKLENCNWEFSSFLS